ncbi:MAG: hypothetical protein WCG75_05000 [Armatimonadota bacterium]
MLLAAIICLATASFKKVKAITVNELYKMSPVIVRAKVDSIEKVVGTRVAMATVFDTFKGRVSGAKVAFVAQPTWECDVSNAKKGESILLYLYPAEPGPPRSEVLDVTGAFNHLKQLGRPLFYVSHSGRGRFQLTEGKLDFTVPVEFVQSNMSDDSWIVNPETRLTNGKLCRHVKKDSYTITLKNMLSYR